MNTPYNTGKVFIGSQYKPKPWDPSRTDIMLQDALLAHKHDKPKIDWDGIWIVLICAFLVAAPYVILAVAE